MSSLTIYLAMLMLGSNFSTTAVSNEPAQVTIQQSVNQSSAVQITDDEQRFIDLVNRERLERGLNALTIDPMLVKVSREHCKEMADKNYFDHISATPGMRTALDRYVSKLGHQPTWILIGENLFYCSIEDVNRGHTCLMNSPGHRDNILNGRFRRIGVGVYKAADGEFWVTQMFLSTID